MRLAIIGNSGSGKSTLAARLGAEFGAPTHDLDALHWLKDGRKRDEASAKALVADVAAGERWIIEGVYGWLAEIALARATALIWLDLPWQVCLDGVRTRGRRPGGSESAHEALIVWAGAYWTRATSSSFAGHHRLFDAFPGAKARLRSRADASAFSLSRGAPR